MTLSARTEYACIAMLDLASREVNSQPVRLRQIADRHGIPSGFLVQILQQLKNAGMVRSTRGASGGYQLTRLPKDISLAEIVDAIEGRQDELNGSAAETAESQVVLEVWRNVCSTQRVILEATTLESLKDRVREEVTDMYYI